MTKNAEILRGQVELSEKEKHLIEYIRKMKNGELSIVVAKGEPERAGGKLLREVAL